MSSNIKISKRKRNKKGY